MTFLLVFFCIVLLQFLLLPSLVAGLKHHLDIKKDERTIFKIETFGFQEGASVQLQLHNFKIHKRAGSLCDIKCQNEMSSIINNDGRRQRRHLSSDARNLDSKKVDKGKKNATAAAAATDNSRYGFLLRKSDCESDAQQDLENIIEKNQCIFDRPNDGWIDIVDMIDVSTNAKLYQFDHIITSEEAGLYSLIFAHCSDDKRIITSTSFHLDAYFINPGPNYLSVGDQFLPSVYFVFFVMFASMTVWWAYLLHSAPGKQAIVHRIHYMMAGLLVLKCITLILESIRLHKISVYGEAEAWSILYYIFAFFKGIMLFTVILLIGSGWSLIKSYLNSREKNIILVVLCLQVIDNIAMIVLEETSPGSQKWLMWRDLLHVVDIVCCLTILFPIVWSINHLRLAAETDGKMSASLQKLQLFRKFYIMVIVYIYFTRIVVFLISASMSYQHLWLGDFSTELVTAFFYVLTGYQFRPMTNNPYLSLRSDEGLGLGKI